MKSISKDMDCRATAEVSAGPRSKQNLGSGRRVTEEIVYGLPGMASPPWLMWI